MGEKLAPVGIIALGEPMHELSARQKTPTFAYFRKDSAASRMTPVFLPRD